MIRSIKGACILMMTLGISLLAQAADRIITVGGDVTEIAYALGIGEQLVGRDSTSTYPIQAQSLPDVGYMRQLNAEGILSLKPDLLLVSEQAEPALILQQLAATGLRVVKINGETSLQQIPVKIRQVAAALNLQVQGETAAQHYHQQLAAVTNTPLNVKVLFILNHNGMTPMAAGQHTAADTMIRASGAQNAMQGFSRYRPLSQEGVIASAPELILITREGEKALGGTEKIWSLPGMAMTPAAQHKRVLVMDDMLLLGFGLRTPEALKQLRQAVEQAAL